jgi:hypothetical protein
MLECWDTCRSSCVAVRVSFHTSRIAIAILMVRMAVFALSLEPLHAKLSVCIDGKQQTDGGWRRR